MGEESWVQVGAKELGRDSEDGGEEDGGGSEAVFERVDWVDIEPASASRKHREKTQQSRFRSPA